VRVAAPVVVKLGGELLDDASRLRTVVSALAPVAAAAPLTVVHGGGKEIDAALAEAGIAKRQVDGLRITDEATLNVVVAVLAGAVNTRLVAALAQAGVAAVGLTGVDGNCGLSELAAPHATVDGRVVDLGHVGAPVATADTRLIETLLADRFVPVVASIGVTREGRLLNVNADTFAGSMAGRLRARRLVIAGTTPGVLDGAGATVRALDPLAIERIIRSGTATAGMIAKLRACELALAGGVADVLLVDGGDRGALEAAASGVGNWPATATRVVPESIGVAGRGGADGSVPIEPSGRSRRG
jgi:acetylglutamate kinase